MFKLSVQTWILNAAAVLSGSHGQITRQAEQSACSRETVYQHARKLQERLPEASSGSQAARAELEAENRQLRHQIAVLQRQMQTGVPCGKDQQQEFAVTAFAMGISLRQVEDLLRLLLPAEEVPDHSTLGRWVQNASGRAAAVLQVLDEASASHVETLAVDEIFFGGGRPWWGSSRRA
jgi:hypothetical protein